MPYTRAFQAFFVSLAGFAVLAIVAAILYATKDGDYQAWKMIIFFAGAVIWCICQIGALMVASGSNITDFLKK